ncbi:hypothetical protein ACFQFQ_14710 [Sulfitobacter porphyrae]|uniref:DUF4365 domain-containing protein n=1 Tax=Sulfitobacter porphyrae TaxID=1246864 RepID=A0ABW2B418_9RHOB|nr:hypothetical protein GCM10007928_02410 [Sulfitobacter porphyrae]
MRYQKPSPKFNTESELCRAFLSCIGEEWTAYNETGNFDILLVHRNGVQIGIEAKLTLNAKVLVQAIDGESRNLSGPDFRAVLVDRVVAENAVLARALGITVITLQRDKLGGRARWRHPNWQGPEQFKYALRWECKLPEFVDYDGISGRWIDREIWYDRAPIERLRLPEYVPDVDAGCPAPQTLSHWKIQAIKVCVYCRKVGRMNRSQFKSLKIDPSRWMTGHWMEKDVERGFWVPTNHFPDEVYRRQHPTVYRQIEADYPEWSVKEGLVVTSKQKALL